MRRDFLRIPVTSPAPSLGCLNNGLAFGAIAMCVVDLLQVCLLVIKTRGGKRKKGKKKDSRKDLSFSPLFAFFHLSFL